MTWVSGVITGAAVIMIAVFASFVVGGQRLLAEIGTGFAVAVALDAFLIRFALVPAAACQQVAALPAPSCPPPAASSGSSRRPP